MGLISAGSISLDSSFNQCFGSDWIQTGSRLKPDSVAILTVYVSVSDPDSIESADPYRESARQANLGPQNSEKL